jgi:phosphoglycolate phosphatase
VSEPKRLLIFDLDGTLIDSQRDLANSVNASRDHLGLAPIEDKLIYSYVGNGAPVLIRRALGPDALQTDVDKALEFFLHFYHDHMLEHTTLYPGVRVALDRLHEAGHQLAVLTNKPWRISEAIVEGLGLKAHFQRVYGGNSFAEKKPHPVGIDTLVSELNSPRETTIMVGDSSVDIRTARNARVMACGVTYGFQPETLKTDPPDLLIDNMTELADYVLGPAAA